MYLRLILLAIPPRILYIYNWSLNLSRKAKLVKLYYREEKVNAFISLGPLEVTILKNRRSFIVSFYSRVYNSLPLGGFIVRTSIIVVCPLKALSTTLWIIT